ncbi:hypothetical protein CJF30_00011247 [Rutstroemia sp. NJR-2017a BBW]|nr:hypothetical protein CJF30_00011247 [Rutstroemia sp. NJR-2017a BBW]
MTSFEPIYYTYIPTAPRPKRGTGQIQSFPLEKQDIVPDRRSFGDSQGTKMMNSNNDNIANNDYNIDIARSFSMSQANPEEDSSLENNICEDKIASPRIDNDNDPSSIETFIDPCLYSGAFIEGLQKGYGIQGTLEDDKSNPNEQESFETGSSSSSSLNYEQSHPLTTRGQDQSGSAYSDPEQLEHEFLPYFFLQRHEDIAMGSMEEESNKQQGHRKRPYLPETDISGDSESDDDTHLAKRSRIRSEDLARLRRIPNSISTAQSPIIDSSTSKIGGNLPAPNDSNHCHSPQSSPSSSLPEPVPTAEYHGLSKDFLNVLGSGIIPPITLSFGYKIFQSSFISPILAEVLGTSKVIQTLSPPSIPDSSIPPAKSLVKRKHVRWEPEEYKIIKRMKKDNCSWNEIHNALPHRTQAAIQIQYSTKLKRR